jgi:hypothetical protein
MENIQVQGDSMKKDKPWKNSQAIKHFWGPSVGKDEQLCA